MFWHELTRGIIDHVVVWSSQVWIQTWTSHKHRFSELILWNQPSEGLADRNKWLHIYYNNQRTETLTFINLWFTACQQGGVSSGDLFIFRGIGVIFREIGVFLIDILLILQLTWHCQQRIKLFNTISTSRKMNHLMNSLPGKDKM